MPSSFSFRNVQFKILFFLTIDGYQHHQHHVLKTKCSNPKTWVIFPMAASSHKHCLIPEVDSQKLHLQILLPRICSLRASMHLSLQLVFCVCLFTVSKQLSNLYDVLILFPKCLCVIQGEEMKMKVE